MRAFSSIKAEFALMDRGSLLPGAQVRRTAYLPDDVHGLSESRALFLTACDTGSHGRLFDRGPIRSGGQIPAIGAIGL